jgi:hypothetical protein
MHSANAIVVQASGRLQPAPALQRQIMRTPASAQFSLLLMLAPCLSACTKPPAPSVVAFDRPVLLDDSLYVAALDIEGRRAWIHLAQMALPATTSPRPFPEVGAVYSDGSTDKLDSRSFQIHSTLGGFGGGISTIPIEVPMIRRGAAFVGLQIGPESAGTFITPRWHVHAITCADGRAGIGTIYPDANSTDGWLYIAREFGDTRPNAPAPTVELLSRESLPLTPARRPSPAVLTATAVSIERVGTRGALVRWTANVTLDDAARCSIRISDVLGTGSWEGAIIAAAPVSDGRAHEQIGAIPVAAFAAPVRGLEPRTQPPPDTQPIVIPHDAPLARLADPQTRAQFREGARLLKQALNRGVSVERLLVIEEIERNGSHVYDDKHGNFILKAWEPRTFGDEQLRRIIPPLRRLKDAAAERQHVIEWDGTLNLSNTAVTDAALADLKDIPALRSLILTHTAVTDQGVAQLKGWDTLTCLRLDQTGVTDASLAAVLKMPNLEHLDLRGTRVTRAGIMTLKRHPKLKMLYLDGLTPRDLAAIHDALPAITIAKHFPE